MMFALSPLTFFLVCILGSSKFKAAAANSVCNWKVMVAVVVAASWLQPPLSPVWQVATKFAADADAGRPLRTGIENVIKKG